MSVCALRNPLRATSIQKQPLRVVKDPMSYIPQDEDVPLRALVE